MSEPHSISSLEYAPASRVDGLAIDSSHLSVRDTLVLIGAGLAAVVAVAFLPGQLRIPGHAILKAALPIACGAALAPRMWAGTLSGSVALIGSAIFLLLGIGHLPAAAMTSLVVIGPVMDLARQGDQSRHSLWLRMVISGLLANLCAYAVRWGSIVFQDDSWQSVNFRQLGTWAFASFVFCGLAAGLLSGMILSRSSLRTENPS